MRPICKLIFTFLLIPILSTVVMSQDIIIKKDGEKVKAKIIEINDTQIRYYEFRDINNLIFTIDRALIKEIRFESGNKYKEKRPGSSEVYYADDRINNLKINFFAIGSGNLIFTFERALDAGSSLETTLRVLTSSYYGDVGLGLNVGYKLKLGNIFKKRNEYRPKHILNGGYFRPVLGYTLSFDDDSYVDFGLDLGKQWILRNAISIDLYMGFHYYTGDRYLEDSDLIGDDGRAFAFGARVGGLFSKRGIKKKKSK